MGNTKNIRTTIAVVVAGAGLFALAVGAADARGGSSGGGGGASGGGGGGGGGDTKQNVLIAANCNGTAFGYAGYNKSGDTASIGFGMNDDLTGADWTVTFTDNGTTFGNHTLPYPGSAWSVLETHVSAKGDHTIGIVATSVAGETCSASLFYKV